MSSRHLERDVICVSVRSPAFKTATEIGYIYLGRRWRQFINNLSYFLKRTSVFPLSSEAIVPRIANRYPRQIPSIPSICAVYLVLSITENFLSLTGPTRYDSRVWPSQDGFVFRDVSLYQKFAWNVVYFLAPARRKPNPCINGTSSHIEAATREFDKKTSAEKYIREYKCSLASRESGRIGCRPRILKCDLALRNKTQRYRKRRDYKSETKVRNNFTLIDCYRKQ